MTKGVQKNHLPHQLTLEGPGTGKPEDPCAEVRAFPVLITPGSLGSPRALI